MRTDRWNQVVWGVLTAGALAWAGPVMAQGTGPGGTGTGIGGVPNQGGGTNGTTNTTGSVQLSDPASAPEARRFYRVLSH